MMENNGWVKFEKTTRTGYLEKYNNRIVVILGRGKSANLYIPKAVLDSLGNPKYIDIRIRGNNIALFASDSESDFKIQSTPGMAMNYISAVTLTKKYGLKHGVYDAHIETGKLVFDMQQVPSRV